MALTKRVAGVEVSRVEPLLQPTNTLFAGAVSEGLRHHRAAGLALQGVVTDLRGGVYRRLDVTLLKAPATLGLRAIRPDTRETVRLELEFYAQGVGVSFATA